MAARIKWTADKIAEIEKLSFKMTRRQIAEKLGCSAAQVSHLIHRLQLSGEWRGSGYTKKEHKVSYTGCNKDCERCPYPDCLIPDHMA